MKLTSDQQFGACHLIVALNAKPLIDICALDVAPRSPLLAGARFRAHEAISPSFIDLQNLRLCLVQNATNLAHLVASKAFIDKTLKRLRVHSLDSVESIIGVGRDMYFNGPRGMRMSTEWFNSIEAHNAPRGLQNMVNNISDQLTRFRAVVSVLRYEQRQMDDEPAFNEIIMSFMDKAIPVITDYHNDALTHDRDLIRRNLGTARSTFIGIKANGWGTWAGESIAELQTLRQNWEVVFEVDMKGVREVSEKTLRAAA